MRELADNRGLYQTHIRALTTKLGALSLDRRAAFAASCCETMAPNFQSFCLVEGVKGWGLVRDGLDALWKVIIEPTESTDGFDAIADGILDVTPDTEDLLISSWLTPLAVDAGLSIASALRLYTSWRTDAVVLIADNALNSIYQYLHQVNSPAIGAMEIDRNYYAFLTSCPLMLAEITRQNESLDLLCAADDKAFVDTALRIRRMASTAGVQPLTRRLVRTI